MNTSSTSLPVLHISTRAAKLNIRQKRPTLTIKHRRPRMQIRKRAPEFKINRSVIDVKKNKMPAIQISHRFIPLPIGKASNFTEDLIDDTASLDSLESRTTQVMEYLKEPVGIKVADDNANESVQLETISLEWDRGYFDIDWTENYMQIDWDVDVSPDIYVEPHDVKIYFVENARHNLRAKHYSHKGVKFDKKI